MRPRDDESGQTPRRRQTQGNADQDSRKRSRDAEVSSAYPIDQDRERAPREGMLTKTGNAHQDNQ
ncbi:MAG: hypothetical protein AAGA60_26300 [Cyanobacteria bacterium P01_E01_bin.42]